MEKYYLYMCVMRSNIGERVRERERETRTGNADTIQEHPAG
jgi:hypothetical protein